MTKWLAPALVLGAAVGLAAAILADYDGEEPKTGLTRAYCPEGPGSDAVAIPADIEDNSAEYRGPGPHPVEIFSNTTGPGTSLWDGGTGELPKTWSPPRNEDGEKAVEAVQLVVCGYQHSVDMEGFLDGCTYGTEPADYTYAYVKAGYTFRVFTARAGKLLGEFELEAVAPKCDSAISVPRGGAGGYHRGPGVPDPAALAEHLARYVDVRLPD